MQEINPISLKDLLLHSRDHKNVFLTIRVPVSRFRKIISDYYSVNGISIEGMLERYATEYDYYTITQLDDNNNVYRIVKAYELEEVKAKCKNCTCGHKRWVSRDTGVCYYNQMVAEDYTTKIYIDYGDTKSK